MGLDLQIERGNLAQVAFWLPGKEWGHGEVILHYYKNVCSCGLKSFITVSSEAVENF